MTPSRINQRLKRRAPTLLPVVALAVLLASCASTGTQRQEKKAAKTSKGSSEKRRDHQVMAILHQAPPTIWRQNIAEIAEDFGMGVEVAWEIPSLEAPCAVFEVPKGRSVEEVSASLGRDHRVELAQPVHFFRLLQEPYNDTHFHLQHGAQTLRILKAHRWSTGKGVTVAVIDTGVDVDHPDLEERVVWAQNLVDSGDQSFTGDLHGTAVVGVIAARRNNHEGIVGVAPDALVLALKACWQASSVPSEALCNTYTLVRAIDLAIRAKAKILNLSLAGPEDPILLRLISKAAQEGTIVVAAVDESSGSGPGFPASMEVVIAVGTADLEGLAAGESRPRYSTGLVAPGIDILTTVPGSTYDFLSGSSLAAAHVTGVVALLLERDPDLTPLETEVLLRKTADLDPNQVRSAPGARIVNACEAVAELVGADSCS